MRRCSSFFNYLYTAHIKIMGSHASTKHKPKCLDPLRPQEALQYVEELISAKNKIDLPDLEYLHWASSVNLESAKTLQRNNMQYCNKETVVAEFFNYAKGLLMTFPNYGEAQGLWSNTNYKNTFQVIEVCIAVGKEQVIITKKKEYQNEIIEMFDFLEKAVPEFKNVYHMLHLKP